MVYSYFVNVVKFIYLKRKLQVMITTIRTSLDIQSFKIALQGLLFIFLAWKDCHIGHWPIQKPQTLSFLLFHTSWVFTMSPIQYIQGVNGTLYILEVFTKHVYKKRYGHNVIKLTHNFTFEHYFGGNAHCKNSQSLIYVQIQHFQIGIAVFMYSMK